MNPEYGNNELSNRRDFFKKAARKILPLLGAITVGPILLSSCETSEPSGGNNNSSSSSGSSRCGGLCTFNCRNECRLNAVWAPTSCNGNCKGACYSTCKTSCYRLSSN